MSFLSLAFAVFFLAAMLLYYTLPKRFQWIVLLTGSVVFYLWSGPKYILYVLATALATYVSALLIERENRLLKERKASLKASLPAAEFKPASKLLSQKSKKRVKGWLLCALAVDLGILIVIKYLDFLIGNVNAIFGLAGDRALRTFSFIMPLGLSYYTFSAIGYILEVMRGKTTEHNFAKFFLYLTYFPQILQGPIPTYDKLAPQFYEAHTFDGARVRSGLQLALWGAFKKLVIADSLGALVASTVSGYADMTGLRIWGGMLVWGIQLYTDFSGGIDMTRGISECFGITLGVNFKRPYFAVSLNNYWDRWHISLSDWLREYLFYPMAIGKTYQSSRKWLTSHCGEFLGEALPNGVISLLLFTLVGIWHGANWGEILFGVFNGVVIFAATLLEPLFAKIRGPLGMDKSAAWRVFRSLRTCFLITVARVLSRAATIGDSFRMLGRMFFSPGFSATFASLGNHVSDGSLIAYLPAAAGCVLLFFVSLAEERGKSVRGLINSRPAALRLALEALCVIAIVIFGAYGLGYDAAGFIYGTKY